MTESKKCPLCQELVECRSVDNDRGLFKWKCRRCGSFISPELGRGEERYIAEKLHLLSGLARELFEEGTPLKIVCWDKERIDELLSGRVPTTVQEKVDRLLQRMAMPQRSEHPGAEFRIDKSNDYPLAYAKNGNELDFFLEHLENSGLALIRAGGSTPGPYRLTTKGWERVEKLKESRATSMQAFVAMHFTKDLQDLYDKGIKPGIEEAGYTPVRVDREEYIGKADDYIIAKIKQSRFMVADMTDQRPSVYFEAGYAMGLGLQVVWLCKDDDVDKLHFDVRQYNHLLWKRGDWEDLRDRLRYRIEATIGRGPVKPAI